MGNFLGGGNTSNSQGRGENDPQRHRELADHHARLMKQSFQAAAQAHQRKDFQQAKALSAQGRRHRNLMKEHNSKASEGFLNKNNSSGGHRFDIELDLHGLYVKEALKVVDERIQSMKEHGGNLIIIFGRGTHSVNGPKLKPAIQQYFTKKPYTVIHDMPNSGCMTVMVPGERTSPMCVVQ